MFHRPTPQPNAGRVWMSNPAGYSAGDKTPVTQSEETMTEQLREKIAREIEKYRHPNKGYSQSVFDVKDLGLIGVGVKEHLLTCANQVLALIKEAGCVFLSDNQEPPQNPYSGAGDSISFYYRGQKQGYFEGQQDMIKTDWRRVELAER